MTGREGAYEAPDSTHCYVCERIALRPLTLSLNDLDTLVRGGGLAGDRHVAEVANTELLRRLSKPAKADEEEPS